MPETKSVKSKKPEFQSKSNLEENIKHLESIAKSLERGEFSINEIVETYKNATSIIKECKTEIQAIENAIIEVDKNN